MKRKKSNVVTILLVLVLIAGLGLMLYPTISNWWNSFHQSKAIVDYESQVSGLDQEVYDSIWESAREYNDKLPKVSAGYVLTDEQKAEYEKQLNVSGIGVMGYINIPKIDCTLPIYHGTEESALQIAIGHLEWTSLPVGGEGTHCVLSGHRGLPRAKLFTRLDEMEEGDYFTLTILQENLYYEVDQIKVVLPEETEDLAVEEGMDFCTLMTCTPYGINSHRLLVRGHRVDEITSDLDHLTSDAVEIEPYLIASIVALPILLAILIYLLVTGRTGRRKE